MSTSTGIQSSILDSVGNTSMLELRNVVPDGSARVLVKLECENPTGSMKDRSALAMVEAAETDGRLPPSGSVVEYTGGSLGVSLALVCAVKRHPLHIVTSDAFSQEKRDHMEAIGAQLTLVASSGGGSTKSLTLEMIETARKIAETSGAYWVDQLNNPDQIPSYVQMGEEIWTQTGGQVDAFIQFVGTSGSLQGVATTLRGHNENIRIVAIEPTESAVLSGGPSGSHNIEGTGAGFVVPLWSEDAADDVWTVSTDEAMAMSRRLAREEGIFAGTSSGGNVVAALRVAGELSPDATVVTLIVDTGLKYLSTRLFKN